jgi:hypothetical protein
MGTIGHHLDCIQLASIDQRLYIGICAHNGALLAAKLLLGADRDPSLGTHLQARDTHYMQRQSVFIAPGALAYDLVQFGETTLVAAMLQLFLALSANQDELPLPRCGIIFQSILLLNPLIGWNFIGFFFGHNA